MNATENKTKRFKKIFTWTCRSLVVLFVLITGFQVFLVFRALNQNDTNDARVDPPGGQENLSLVSSDQLFEGVWKFENVKKSMLVGSTNDAGLTALISSYEKRFVEKEMDSVIDWQRFFSSFESQQLANRDSSAGKNIIRKTYINPEHPGDVLLIVAFEPEPGQWWYLATDFSEGNPMGHNENGLNLGPFEVSQVAPGMKCLARKFNGTGELILAWTNVGKSKSHKRKFICDQWSLNDISFTENFPDYPDRFDYTCMLADKSVRVLGICDGDNVSDLIVIRL